MTRQCSTSTLEQSWHLPTLTGNWPGNVLGSKALVGSEATSFLWKLLYRILPSEERVARIIPNSSPNCRQCPTPTLSNLEHIFFSCVCTQHVGRSLLSAIRLHAPDVTPSGLLRLEFSEQGEKEMPLVWITGQTLHVGSSRPHHHQIHPGVKNQPPQRNQIHQWVWNNQRKFWWFVIDIKKWNKDQK